MGRISKLYCIHIDTVPGNKYAFQKVVITEMNVVRTTEKMFMLDRAYTECKDKKQIKLDSLDTSHEYSRTIITADADKIETHSNLLKSIAKAVFTEKKDQLLNQVMEIEDGLMMLQLF